MRPFHDDPRALRAAQDELAFLLPQSRAFLETERGRAAASAAAWNAMSRAMMGHMRIDNILGVFVFEDGGFWFSEIVLKSTPSGVGSVIGTHPASLAGSRDEARRAATMAVGIIIATEAARIGANAADGVTLH